MGGKSSGSAPRPPDPQQTAGAQTQAGITSSIANNVMGMVDQHGPNGAKLTYKINQMRPVRDPNTGVTYQVPEYSSRYTAGPVADAAALDQARASRNLSGAAVERSKFLQGHLSQAVNQNELPEMGGMPNAAAGVKGTGRMNIRPGEGLRYTDEPGATMNTSGIARSYGPEDGFSADRQRVEDALMQRMQPQLDRDREQLQTRLANQGIGMGSDAYGSAQDDFGRSVNDARLGAILAGGEEQSRLSGLAMQQAGFQNAAQGQAFGQHLDMRGFDNATQSQAFNQAMQGTALDNSAQAQRFGQQAQVSGMQDGQRQNAMAEQFAYRSQPINEITALLSGGQIQSPQFSQNFRPSQMPTPDVAGLINSNYQQQNAAYQQNRANRGSLFGNLIGAGGMIGSAMMPSDARLKTDIRHIGERAGIPLYEYAYRYDPTRTRRRGYLAQEVATVRPEAVVQMGAWLGLDYSLLPEVV